MTPGQAAYEAAQAIVEYVRAEANIAGNCTDKTCSLCRLRVMFETYDAAIAAAPPTSAASPQCEPMSDAELAKVRAGASYSGTTIAELGRLLARLDAVTARLPIDATAPSFDDAWRVKEAEGYQYGHDALEQVSFGWELREAYAAAPPTSAGATEETDWNDVHDKWSTEIEAAYPTRSGSHDEYATAMAMVGNRQSKGQLVALVNWLLMRWNPKYAATPFAPASPPPPAREAETCTCDGFGKAAMLHRIGCAVRAVSKPRTP